MAAQLLAWPCVGVAIQEQDNQRYAEKALAASVVASLR